MKASSFIPIILLAMICSAIAGEKEKSFLDETMIPLVRQFVERNGLPTADLTTNGITKYRVDFFTDGRLGGQASLKLKNGYSFGFISNGTNAEIWRFADANVRTYYVLTDAPKEKIKAVKALNLSNKLTEKAALELAEKFFKLQGHKESNFHSPEIHQCYWVGTEAEPWGPLPYYQLKWYRKDVTDADREAGIVLNLHEINIAVSGVTSNLISYDKISLPIGRDF
jgi:hypothetical protein